MDDITKGVIEVNSEKCFKVFHKHEEKLTVETAYGSAFKSGFQCGMMYKDNLDIKNISDEEIISEVSKRFSNLISLNKTETKSVVDTVDGLVNLYKTL